MRGETKGQMREVYTSVRIPIQMTIRVLNQLLITHSDSSHLPTFLISLFDHLENRAWTPQVVEGAPDSVTLTITQIMRVHGWDFFENDAWSVRRLCIQPSYSRPSVWSNVSLIYVCVWIQVRVLAHKYAYFMSPSLLVCNVHSLGRCATLRTR